MVLSELLLPQIHLRCRCKVKYLTMYYTNDKLYEIKYYAIMTVPDYYLPTVPLLCYLHNNFSFLYRF